MIATSGLGWAVAGILLLGSGGLLCLRAGSRAAGALFACAGVLLLVAGLAPTERAAWSGVAAMAALASATVAFPRLLWDLPRALALASIVVGTPWLAWQLSGPAGPSSGDLVWVAFALTSVAGGHVWWRLETTDRDTRSSLLWVLSSSAVAMFLVGIVALAGSPTGPATVVHASLGLVGVAALLGADRTRRLDGRWLASRASAVFFSTGCAFAVATLVLTLVDWRSGATPGIVALALTSVLCGTLWTPLLALVQRVADGVMFGFRPDALTAAQRVAVSIGDDPTAAIRAIKESLLLPFVALALDGDDPVEVGEPPEHLRVFPVDSDGKHVGDLVVGVRPGDLSLSRDDERVLTLSLPLLVQTIRARSLAATLQRARMASASTREEERRRLRRDLHDGLGPRLTGIAFTADAARLAASGHASAPMLDRIRREAELALDEIRELVYGLRPPALDELGLVGAIRLGTDTHNGLRTEVAAGPLPILPAAVEVAAYRIVMEALTNVARHSGATRARIELRDGPHALMIEVTDNGRGGSTWVPGIGLTSMKERASELGGTVTCRGTPSGGIVTALLPFAAAEPGAAEPGSRRSDDGARSLA